MVLVKMKQGLTAGEASKMLRISIHRVERLFDRGTLTGWKNPVTGWRVIDPKSVNALVAFTQKRAVTLRKAVDDFVRRGHKKG